MEIANSYPKENYKPWFAQQARAKAEWDADIGDWSPQQVHEFHQKLDCTRRITAIWRSSAHFRLLDLKDDLENGDSSIAGILKGVSLETDIENTLGVNFARKPLADTASPQEEELADIKKTRSKISRSEF